MLLPHLAANQCWATLQLLLEQLAAGGYSLAWGEEDLAPEQLTDLASLAALASGQGAAEADGAAAGSGSSMPVAALGRQQQEMEAGCDLPPAAASSGHGPHSPSATGHSGHQLDQSQLQQLRRCSVNSSLSTSSWAAAAALQLVHQGSGGHGSPWDDVHQGLASSIGSHGCAAATTGSSRRSYHEVQQDGDDDSALLGEQEEQGSWGWHSSVQVSWQHVERGCRHRVPAPAAGAAAGIHRRCSGAAAAKHGSLACSCQAAAGCSSHSCSIHGRSSDTAPSRQVSSGHPCRLCQLSLLQHSCTGWQQAVRQHRQALPLHISQVSVSPSDAASRWPALHQKSDPGR